MSADNNDMLFRVVHNDEEQYSIWPSGTTLPDGWHDTGFSGDRSACLAHVDEVWTDLRPLSLRRALAEAPGDTGTAEAEPAPDLVSRLCAGDHPVEVVLRPRPSLAGLRAALDNRYLHLRFPETAGGTEVGIALSTSDTDVSGADLGEGTGRVRLVGELTLDFTPLRCEAVVDVADLTGRGHLRRA